MKKYPRFAVRTVRNGKVSIFGKVFFPQGQDVHPLAKAYSGELDGMRFAFGLYRTIDGLEEFVCLWGTEEIYRSKLDPDSDEYEKIWDKQPNFMSNGEIEWNWWITEKYHQKELMRQSAQQELSA